MNFTPSYVKSYSTALLVDVDEAGREVFSIPITAKSTVPPVTLITQLLDYGRCFLRYPYSHNVEIMNDTSLPVKYEMPPQVREKLILALKYHNYFLSYIYMYQNIIIQVPKSLFVKISYPNGRSCKHYVLKLLLAVHIHVHVLLALFWATG